MCDQRATKSGIARDVQNKLLNKYDQAAAKDCMEWVKRATGCGIDTSGNIDNVYEDLRSGFVLVHLINKILPGKLKSAWLTKPQTMPFKQMEQINEFLRLIKDPPICCSEHDCFATTDLFEKQNMTQVITCLESLARKLLTVQTPVQGYGKKEAVVNQREFSEEQLKQGQNVIGLQMGSNKGASQAGQNFGKARMIVD